MHVHPGLQREARLGVMQPDRRRDRDGVHAAVGEQRLEIGERLRDAEALGDRICATRHRVAHGRHLHAILHVVLREVRQQAAQRDRARADDAQAQRERRPSWPFLLLRDLDGAALGRRTARARDHGEHVDRAVGRERRLAAAAHDSTSCSTPSR